MFEQMLKRLRDSATASLSIHHLKLMAATSNQLKVSNGSVLNGSRMLSKQIDDVSEIIHLGDSSTRFMWLISKTGPYLRRIYLDNLHKQT